MSAALTTEFLAVHVPGFAALRRVAGWPAPLGRPVVRRWLRRYGGGTGRPAVGAAAGAVLRALRLVTADDREVCRRVHLDGWRHVVDRRADGFELVDERGEFLWPVAVRALILFAAATPEHLSPPRPADSTSLRDAGASTLTVRTEVSSRSDFRVVIEARSQ